MARRGASAGPSRGRVLLVDGNPLTLHMAGRFLLRQGFEVAKATGPARALPAGLPFAPEVALPGAMMPGLSGFEYAAVLREALGPGVRIVMLTAPRSGAGRERAQAAGAGACLTKPVRPGELLGAPA